MGRQTTADLVSRARALHRQLRTPENSLEIRELLQKALADPASLAPSELAETCSLLAEILMCDYLNSWNGARAGELTLAEDATRRALEIVPNLAGAHYASGLIHRARGRHEAALAAFARSVELNPDFALAHAQQGAQLIYTGRPLEALPLIEAALRISHPQSPARPMFCWYMGRAYFYAGKHGDAIPWLQQSVEGRRNLWYNRLYLVSAHALAGDRDAAAEVLRAFNVEFSNFTLARVIASEQTNPNDNPIAVAARQQFHDGLLRAGMPAQ
jgi:tetratricopeptide (TPR) repeat protein